MSYRPKHQSTTEPDIDPWEAVYGDLPIFDPTEVEPEIPGEHSYAYQQREQDFIAQVKRDGNWGDPVEEDQP